MVRMGMRLRSGITASMSLSIFEFLYGRLKYNFGLQKDERVSGQFRKNVSGIFVKWLLISEGYKNVYIFGVYAILMFHIVNIRVCM